MIKSITFFHISWYNIINVCITHNSTLNIISIFVHGIFKKQKL